MEEVAREEEEKVASVRAEIPGAAFEMPLEEAGIKEHTYNILTEAGYEMVGDLMLKMELDQDSVLGLSGIGPKAMENIEESLAAVTFPEPPPPLEPTVESVAEEADTKEEPEPQPELVLTDTSVEVMGDTAEAVEDVVEEAVAAAEETPLEEKPAKVKKEPRKKVEEEGEDEGHKDGVSLDELFRMKPEIFEGADTDDDDETKDTKKGKKRKKKSVALEYDEELGEVIARKKHKRGDDDYGDEW
jgi:N utilization substance protein A